MFKLNMKSKGAGGEQWIFHEMLAFGLKNVTFYLKDMIIGLISVDSETIPKTKTLLQICILSGPGFNIAG
jgi:hypothetical protein